MLKMLAIMGVFIAVLAFVKWWQISKAIAASANFGPPPTAITTFIAQETAWSPAIDVVGSLEAAQGTVLKSEERGKVTKIGFESGALVNAGDLLVQLDISTEAAQLRAAEAKAELAGLTLKRSKFLKAGNAMAEATLDEAVAGLKEADGEVAALKAQIAKKTITAPFSGRSGIRMVNVGQYLAEGTPIVPLFSTDPMYANFAIPQTQLQFLATGQKVTLTVDTFPGRNFSGSVTALDPQIDDVTRNVKVQATINNTDGALRAGMFANIHLQVAQEEKRITIPGSAVYRAPYGDSVFVVEKQTGPDKKEFLGVTQKFVKTGERRGDQVSIVKGLEVGQEVATSALFKLRPGAPITVNNSITPGNDPSPKPADT